MIDVTTEGGSHHLDIRRDGAGWLVTLNGRTRRIDLRRDGSLWSLLDFGVVGLDAPAPAARSHELAVDLRAGDEAWVHVDGRPLRVQLPSLAPPRRRRHGGATAGGGSHRVVAPMPGRVVKVLVATGEHVTERQPLVVIEAMKMQNELRAAGTGVVGTVHAVEGALVDAGAPLIDVLPDTGSGERRR